MKHRFSSELKKFFRLTKSEQRGVAVLLFLIFIILLINLLLPLLAPHKTYNYSQFQSEINRFLSQRQQLEDSLTIEKLQNSGALDEELAKQKLKPFPFNPNHLSEKQWLKMGLTKKQVHTIKKYEAKGGKFRKKEDLKKIYALSEVEYKILAPYILIPREFVSAAENPMRQKKTYNRHSLTPVKMKKTAINQCDSATLMTHLGLSPWLSARIIKYRRLLGGFYNKKQLLEVYGMQKQLFHKIEKHLVIDTSNLHKININNAGFKTILHHPYLGYRATKEIMNGRKTRGGYQHLEEIKEDLKLTDTALEKLKPYLAFRPIKDFSFSSKY